MSELDQRFAFDAFWRHYFGDFPPLAWDLKGRLEWSWLRFHSLPDSKQYPDNEQEWTTVLHRYSTVAREVLGNNSECWFCSPYWTDETERGYEKNIPDGLIEVGREEYSKLFAESIFPIQLKFAGAYYDPEYYDDVPVNIHACVVNWKPARFKKLLRLIADEEFPSGPMWIRCDEPAVFAPYGGGMDVFVRSERQAEQLLRRHKDYWPAPGFPGRPSCAD